MGGREMKIYFECDEDERMTNFRVAEAVINLCNKSWELDAEAVAKMILLQVEAERRDKDELH
jgi:hypothetical protein